MAGFNTFKVLQPLMKETYNSNKLKKPKLPKLPAIPGQKKIKIVTPGGY